MPPTKKEKMMPRSQQNQKTFFLSKFSSADSLASLETSENKYDAFHLEIKSFSKKKKQRLFEILSEVATSAFGREGDEGFKKELFKYLCESDHVLMLFKGNELVAYRQWTVLDSSFGKIGYLGGAFIKRDIHGQGVGTEMLNFMVKSLAVTNPDWKYLAVATQNAIVLKAFNSLVARQNSGTLFQYGDTYIPEDVQEVVRVIAASDKDTSLNPTTLLSKGLYGSSVYAKDVKIADINKGTILESIDIDKGDAVYSIWRR